MHPEWRRLIEAIHRAPHQSVIAVTGGGASAIAELLAVPGGSRTVLEAIVPYSAAALAAWLGRRPEHFCAEETALAMAAVAYERACRLAADSEASSSESGTRWLVGVACTAALVSDRPKKGEHRCHVAVQTVSATSTATIALQKGARDRTGEEQIVGRLILASLAGAAGIDDRPSLELLPAEGIVEAQARADANLVDLRTGRRDLVWSLPGGTLQTALSAPVESLSAANPGVPAIFAPPRGVLCGAFNPLHYGHEELRRVAEQRLAGPVYYELSLRNVDKPPLDYLTIDHRRMQFTRHPLALTSAPTFAEKAAVLPGTVFVVGVDTAERIIQPKYYGGSQDAMHQALADVRNRGCRFLVAGRKQGDCFQTLDDLMLPPDFAGLFEAIPPQVFRADVSSTELRSHQ